MVPSDVELVRAARAEAHALGYLLMVDQAENMPEGLRWIAHAAPEPAGGFAAGRFLS